MAQSILFSVAEKAFNFQSKAQILTDFPTVNRYKAKITYNHAINTQIQIKHIITDISMINYIAQDNVITIFPSLGSLVLQTYFTFSRKQFGILFIQRFQFFRQSFAQSLNQATLCSQPLRDLPFPPHKALYSATLKLEHKLLL